MTAELIVMNKNGLALAADSAVSVATGGRATKVYNTANKLFSLSKYRPIAVMIYGSAEIMGLPWEVVIKRYREFLGERSFASLAGYIDDFFDHLKKQAFTPDCYIAYVRQRAVELFNVIANDVDTRVEEHIKENDGIEEADLEGIHSNCIKEAYDSIRTLQKNLKIKRADIQESLANHRGVVREAIDELLEDRPVKGPVKRKLIDACLLVAIVFPGMNQSGLVIAGFGDSDVFPSARAFEIHKILDGNIHFYQTFEGHVSLDNTVYIKAFAQANETQNFMNGVSARLDGYIAEDAAKILSGAFAEKVTEQLVEDHIVAADKQDDCKARLAAAGKGVHAFIKSQIDGISQREFSGPVVNAVAFFSPTEMASMAETLVSLESFKQQVTLRSETVGGPIDVAVITRGDGFIWIKRKHYFTPELNHQFFTNYNRRKEPPNDD
jgi:hypothetical protein